MLVGGRDRATAIPDPHTAGIPMPCCRSCTGARTRGGVFEFKDELFADPRLRRLVAQPGGLLSTGSEGSDVRCLRCSGRFQNVVLLAHFSFLHRPPAAIPRIALLLTLLMIRLRFAWVTHESLVTQVNLKRIMKYHETRFNTIDVRTFQHAFMFLNDFSQFSATIWLINRSVRRCSTV